MDYALCHPPREPLVMVEVKQIGQSKGADHQLFEYAFHKGVPMAVLTDGQEWHFFLPTEQGDYGERRVYKLDLSSATLKRPRRVWSVTWAKKRYAQAERTRMRSSRSWCPWERQLSGYGTPSPNQAVSR